MRSFEAGMNTGPTDDKSEGENLYKTAFENSNKTESNTLDTIHTSTPFKPPSSESKKAGLLDNSENKGISTDFSKPLVLDPFDSADFQGSTINHTYMVDSKSEALNETMANHNPFATLKYAVDAVPFFDGKNIPLSYFIEGCEEAKSMLPNEAESQFTKIIRTRIVGEARRTIQDQDFDSVSQLTKFLKQVYSPLKNIYQLQGELGRVYQKNEEDVVTYANRVKLLGKQIMEAHKISGSSLPERDIKTSLEKDMCKCFIRGLKPEIEQRIARDLGVQETVADALQIEREFHSMTDLRQGEDNGSNKTSNTNKSRDSCQICFKEGHLASNCRKLTNFGMEILICQICKKRGHSADKCRLRDPQTRLPINILQGNNITCQLCSKPGHNAKNCRSSNNHNQNTTSVICQWCEKSGHSANNCWKKQNEERNSENKIKTVCQICSNFGHVAKDCRSKMHNAVASNSLFCRYCKEQGHLLESCELRIASNNRRKAIEQGNSDGPSKPGVLQGSERISHPSTSKKVQ